MPATPYCGTSRDEEEEGEEEDEVSPVMFRNQRYFSDTART